MDRQIIEISNDGFNLSLYRGFLVVENKNQGLKSEIPLDNILALILSANNVSVTKNIINAIAEQGGNIICCGKNYLPSALTTPYTGHWLISSRVRRQIDCSKPLQNNLWKSIVQNKIFNHAKIREYVWSQHPRLARLKQLARETLSNDAKNNEGTAAAIYFKSLFGKNFVRDRLGNNANILLNYTYIVLRAMVARSIAGNGLLPYLGLKHCTKSNPLPLVDDLIEPFRAIADKIVFEQLNQLVNIEQIELTPEIKRNLTKIITFPVLTGKGCVSLSEGINDFVNSLVTSFELKKVVLQYPTIQLQELSKRLPD